MIDNDEIGRALTKALQDRINIQRQGDLISIRVKIEGFT